MRAVLVALVLIPCLALADTETLAPESESDTTTNLTGDVAGDCDSVDCFDDVNDDPDSPDGTWAVADSNNVNTSLVLDFPTPTGSPTTGADKQTFKCWVREEHPSQSGTPNGRVELWENGTLVRAGDDTGLTTTGEMVSMTWDASELATSDGSLVQVAFIGTKSGGSPGARNSSSLDACEWNVEYTAGGGGGTRRVLVVN